MAQHNIPYMSVPGSIVKILEKIKTASTPDNFNGEFLEKTLGFKGGNYRTFIPWAKKINLINTDGTPSQLYKKFRNPDTSKSSLGTGLIKGYSEIYSKNESFFNLEKPKLKGLFMEATGEAHDSKVLELMVNSFWNAKTLAEFSEVEIEANYEQVNIQDESAIAQDNQSFKKLNFGLSYTINLVLPKTDDPSIYNAIFKSLKDNLLKD